jgi:hypothetical protein
MILEETEIKRKMEKKKNKTQEKNNRSNAIRNDYYSYISNYYEPKNIEEPRRCFKSHKKRITILDPRSHPYNLQGLQSSRFFQ